MEDRIRSHPQLDPRPRDSAPEASDLARLYEAQEAAEARLGRELTAAEKFIDIVQLNRDLSDGKEALAEAIDKEKKRAFRALMRRQPNWRPRVTEEMLDALVGLYQLGKEHAERELESMGYGDRNYSKASDEEADRKRRAANMRRRLRRAEQNANPDARRVGLLKDMLESLLMGLGLRIRAEVEKKRPELERTVPSIEVGFGAIVGDRILREMERKVPGSRDVASRIVSKSLYSGLGATLEQSKELIPCWEYSAVMDSATSFARGTLVETDVGPVPIEDLTGLEMVATLGGWSRVLRRIARRYCGPVVVLTCASGRQLRVTPEHLLAAPGEWKRAELFGVGEVLLHGCPDLLVTDDVHLESDDSNSLLPQTLISTGVSLTNTGTAMGATVSLEREVACQEVDDVRADLLLPHVLDPEFVEDLREPLLARSRQATGTMATLGRAVAQSPALRTEQRRADRTGSDGLSPTLARAAPVTVGVRAWNGERAATGFAELLDSRSGVAADEAAIALGAPARSEGGTAEQAVFAWISTLSDSRPHLAAGARAAGDAWGRDARPALAAVIHDRIVTASVEEYDGYVWDVTTEDGSLLANGLVAHNCASCRVFDGERYETWEDAMVVLPDGGPNPMCFGDGRCRCRIVPCLPGARFDVPDVEPEPETPLDRLQHELGDQLRVDSPDHPTVAQHVNELDRLPSAIREQLAAEGVRWHLGPVPMPDLDDFGHMRGVTPRGWEGSGATWDDVAGAYDNGSKWVTAGVGHHGARSLVLHETGHAIYYHVLDHHDLYMLKSHHRRLYNNKLGSYFKQGGPGADAGVQELFAEAVAKHLMGDDLTRAYDEPFAKFMLGILFR